MVHTICFNVFSKGNYWCFLWYLHSCPLETILPLAQIYSLEKIKCGSYHQILLFLHDKIQPLWQVLCKYNRISALDKWGSTWSRWMSHWRTVHFQTQLVHQNTASDQKHTEVQVSVSSNWSGLFQHHSCSDASRSTTPAAELSEKLWRAVSVLCMSYSKQ